MSVADVRKADNSAASTATEMVVAEHPVGSGTRTASGSMAFKELRFERDADVWAKTGSSTGSPNREGGIVLVDHLSEFLPPDLTNTDLTRIPRWLFGATAALDAAARASKKMRAAKEVARLVQSAGAGHVPLAFGSTAFLFGAYHFLLGPLIHLDEQHGIAKTPAALAVSALKEAAATRASIWAAARSGAAIGATLPWKPAGIAGGFIVGAGIGYFTGLTVEQFVGLLWNAL